MTGQQEQLGFMATQGDSNVYVVKERGKPCFKIGKANSIERRHTTLSAVYDFDYSGGYCLNVADAKEARALEKMLHIFCKKFSAADDYKGLDGGTEMYHIDALPGVLKHVLEHRERHGILSIKGFAAAEDCANVLRGETITDLADWWQKARWNLAGLCGGDKSWLVAVFVGLVVPPSVSTCLRSGRVVNAVSWARYIDGHTIISLQLPDGDWAFDDIEGGDHYAGLAALTNDPWLQHVRDAGSRSGAVMDELLNQARNGGGFNLLGADQVSPRESKELAASKQPIEAKDLVAIVNEFRGGNARLKSWNCPIELHWALKHEVHRLTTEVRPRSQVTEKDLLVGALLLYFERQGIEVSPSA